MSDAARARRMDRLALAIAVFGLVACASYAIQRVIDARGEPPMGAVTQLHIAYYWRVGAAALHGLTAAALAGWGLSEARVEWAMERLPWGVWLAAIPAAIAVALTP